MEIINTNLRMYDNKFQPYVLDINTGISYKVSFAYKTASVAEIHDAYAASPLKHVGYLAAEYNVYRIEETGEAFVYPFSFGYADHDAFRAYWCKPVVEAAPVVAAPAKPAPTAQQQTAFTALEFAREIYRTGMFGARDARDLCIALEDMGVAVDWNADYGVLLRQSGELLRSEYRRLQYRVWVSLHLLTAADGRWL